MQIQLKRGVSLAYDRNVQEAEIISPVIGSIGYTGRDFIGLLPQFKVKEGDNIEPGQELIADRRKPQIRVISPISGRVEEIRRRHPQTKAFSIKIIVDGIETYAAPASRAAASRGTLRETLLRNGLWPALRQRPFGIVADPLIVPDAILVCATPADELAADPLTIIAAAREFFEAGLRALQLLTDGPVHVTQPPGQKVAESSITVEGPFPAGLPGPQIHALRRSTHARTIWWLNYQDVIAIGRLLNEHEVAPNRPIAIAGPGLDRRYLAYAPPGASISDLTSDLIEEGEAQIISGPALAGRRDEYLGRHHLQVSVLKVRPKAPEWIARLAKAFRINSMTPGPIIPIAAHDNSFPFDIPVVPMLRALATGDTESAAQMGCRDLIEEDIAYLSHICPSRNNYEMLLRNALDDLRRNR